MTDEYIYTVKQAAAMIGVSPRTIRHYITTEQITPFLDKNWHSGKRWMLSEADVGRAGEIASYNNVYMQRNRPDLVKARRSGSSRG
jgi:DNA-binding transcriptional MerR regulator